VGLVLGIGAPRGLRPPGFDLAHAEKLAEFAAFNGCEEIVVEKARPAKLRAAIRRELKARAKP